MPDEKIDSEQNSHEPSALLKRIHTLEASEAQYKEALNAALENEHTFRSLFNAASDAICIIDRNGRFLEVNRVACECFGYSREELLTMGAADVCDSEHMTLVWNQIQLTFRNGSLVFDLEYVARDGTVTPTEINAKVITYRSQPAILSIARDISRRRSVENALKLQRDFAESLIDIAHAIVLVLDANCKVVRVNRYFEELTGWRRERARGMAWISTFIPAGERSRIWRIFTQAMSSRQTVGMVNPILVKNGRERHIQWYSTALTRPDGQATGLLCIGHDIDEALKTQDELRKARQELERRVKERTAQLAESNRELELEIRERRRTEKKLKASLQEKEVLLQEIHHRAKNNMQIISSLMNLQAAKLDDPVLRSIINDSQRRVRAMSMVHDALCYTETMADVDLKRYIEKLTDALLDLHASPQRRVNLSVDCEPLSIGVDLAVILGLIITELVSNSFKYAFEGREEGRIDIRARETPGEELEVVVADDGVGMPEKPAPDERKLLGLKLVIGMMEQQLGGRVELQGDDGTRFALTVGREAYLKRYLSPARERFSPA